MVDDVRFAGNRAIGASDLAPIINTERTSIWRRWFGWSTGTLTCLDSAELVNDASRMADLYEQRGYPGTTVRPQVARHADRATVTFVIRESVPIRIGEVRIDGLPAIARIDVGALQKRMRGATYDDSVVNFVTDSLQRLLHDAGFAAARPPLDSSPPGDSAAKLRDVRLIFRPGARVTFGAINIAITAAGKRPALDAGAIRRLVSVKAGAPYSERAMVASQRDLYQSGIYKTVRVDTGSIAHDTLPVSIALMEGDRRRLRAGGGWGTLDCFRVQSRFVEQNLLGSGHRLEVNGRMSKIGLAHPFAGFDALCAPRLRQDPFSTKLNYYVGATVDLRGVPGASLKPTVTVFSERRSEYLAYETTTDIGVVTSVTRETGARRFATLQYQYLDSRTLADRAVSCTTFGFCRLEDLTSFLLSSPIHTLGLTVVKNPLSPTSDPERGYRWQADVKYGYTEISRRLPLNFVRFGGEAAWYHPIGADVAIAVRGQIGFVAAPNDRSALLPPQERFYGGGQNTVRGFNQNQLGPGSYIVSAIDTVRNADGTTVGVARAATAIDRMAPSGGNAMALANVEFRTRRGWPGDLLRWVLFVDAGRVWNTNDVFSFTNTGLRITPGIGVRLVTPLGPFRVDIGYNPYGLEAGPAFYVEKSDLANGKVGRAICVSPGSTDPLTLRAGESGVLNCPASFTPVKSAGLLPRLAFHFSIGNAF
jgi:outer membrane protein assembly factor BamA